MGIKEIYAKIDEMSDQLLEKIEQRANASMDLFTRLCVKSELMVFMIETMDAGEVIPEMHQVEVPAPGPVQYVGSDKFPPAPPSPTMFYGGSVYYGMQPAGDYGLWHDAAGRPHILDKKGDIEARSFGPTFSGSPALHVVYLDDSENPDVYPTDVNWPKVKTFKSSEIPF